MRGCHFISGLPRSGSTLLSAILNQNPEFKAHIISPVEDLVHFLTMAMGSNNELYPLINDVQRAAVLTGVFNNFHEPLGDTGKIIFDSNRAWCARIDLINLLFPDAKIIACVRDPAMIFDSLERITRANPILFSKLYTTDFCHTVFNRAEYQNTPKGMIRFAWNATREACYGPHGHKVIVVDYEDLATKPADTMAMIYQRLDLPLFVHSFNNVKLDGVDEYDRSLGVPGLHTVRPKVELIEQPTVVPPEIMHSFSWPMFWKR